MIYEIYVIIAWAKKNPWLGIIFLLLTQHLNRFSQKTAEHANKWFFPTNMRCEVKKQD